MLELDVVHTLYNIGQITYDDGNAYDGYWENDMKNGIGTLIYNNGDQYKGEWKDNKKNGKGSIMDYSRNFPAL